MKIQDGTYHKDLGNLPLALLHPFLAVEFSLVYSRHAQRAVLDDKYGPPTRVPFKTWFDITSIIEVEIVGGNVAKLVIRTTRGRGFEHRNPDLDLVLVLSIQSAQCRELFVKTLWFNDRTDNHATLDRTKYVNP